MAGDGSADAAAGLLGGFGPGSRLASYLLEEQLGAGGMAVVFRAVDERLGRPVALKIMAPALASDRAFRQRFLRESRAAAAVDDEYIIPIYEAGEAAGVLFIAMRLVPGTDVRALLHEHGPLPPGRTATIVSQVASALDAAHAAGLVHRDVKPANMLIHVRAGRPDHVYLSDFGISKADVASMSLTGTGQFLGSPNYIAPEQIEHRTVDGRTDQYALACAAFELLAGEPPFQRDQGMAIIWAHLSELPPPLGSLRPGLPPAADIVFARALAKSPQDRFSSCREFADALSAALGPVPEIRDPADQSVHETGPLAEDQPAPEIREAASPAAQSRTAHETPHDNVEAARKRDQDLPGAPDPATVQSSGEKSTRKAADHNEPAAADLGAHDAGSQDPPFGLPVTVTSPAQTARTDSEPDAPAAAGAGRNGTVASQPPGGSPATTVTPADPASAPTVVGTTPGPDSRQPPPGRAGRAGRRLTALILAGVAAAAAAAAAVIALSSGTHSGTETIVVTSNSPQTNTDYAVTATGVVTASGTDINGQAQSILKFPGGQFVVHHHQRYDPPSYNTQTCQAIQRFAGNDTIGGGTGKYAGITGSGTFHGTLTWTLRRTGGHCQANGSPVPGSEHLVIRGSGPLTLP